MIRKQVPRLSQDRAGTTAVEFAIVIGPFCLLLFGCIEVGRLAWSRHALEQVTAASARCVGLLAGPCTTNSSYDHTKSVRFAQAQAQKWSITLPDDAIEILNSTSCANLAGFSQVSVNYAFQSLFPTVITALSGDVNLRSTACFPNRP
ncbi:TadE/TadG family type IV pilus assembly protein [Methylobacterium sp. ID0610]|uniref:TadE/TadG family type IV pilus assembly protein n=1 Tax=Methylobacterium carpenticola TaxID=3344827 RepID=UPI00368D0EE9